jgi:hypothetical protein
MVLKWIYYGVSMILVTPYLLWNAFVSLIMWDAKYWDNACYGVYQGLDDDHFNSKK